MHSFITSVLLIVILAPGHILRLVADLPHIIVNCSRGTPSKSGVVVGVDGTGEERSAVGLGGVSGLANGAWTIKPVQLFGSTARTVSSIWVLADQVVLAGDEPLNTAAAVDVLVAGVLHGPLPILSGAVSYRLRFLEQDPAILLAGVLKWQTALLAIKIEDQPILAQELGGQFTRLVAHVEPVTLLLVRHEVPVPIGWYVARNRGLATNYNSQHRHGSKYGHKSHLH